MIAIQCCNLVVSSKRCQVHYSTCFCFKNRVPICQTDRKNPSPKRCNCQRTHRDQTSCRRSHHGGRKFDSSVVEPFLRFPSAWITWICSHGENSGFNSRPHWGNPMVYVLNKWFGIALRRSYFLGFCIRWLEQVPNIFSQMVVKMGMNPMVESKKTHRINKHKYMDGHGDSYHFFHDSLEPSNWNNMKQSYNLLLTKIYIYI